MRPAHAFLGALDDLVDLAIPRTCGGCGAPGVRWCGRCEAALHDVPARIRSTVDTGVPVWTLGRYDGPRRCAVLHLKERGRGDLAEPLGRAVAHGVLRLRAWHEVTDPLVLVPAPTTRWAARRRGGDVVTAVCRAAARAAAPVCPIAVAPVLRSVGRPDSVGLSAAARSDLAEGTVRLVRRPPAGAVVLVDDVITTGATLAEAAAVLARRGVVVAAAVTIAAA